MKILNRYRNGNANITIMEDGTRITQSDDDVLNLDYPLSIDLCVSHFCKYNCPFCYMNATSNGKHADYTKLNFLKTLPAGCEVAFAGGSATEYPDLIPFTKYLKSLGLIANMTVNQSELIEHIDLINDLIDKELIHGLGVSYKEPCDLIYKSMEQPNMVVHLIAGIHSKEELDYLSQFNLKIIILGYKNIGRGYYYKDALDGKVEKKIEWLKNNIKNYMDKFEVISFDCLALEQLDIKSTMSENDWERFYQGTDGEVSFYVDAVDMTFSKSSLECENKFPLLDDAKEIFSKVKELK